MVDTQATNDLERRLAALERRIGRREKSSAVESAFWALVHGVFPEEARQHMKAAGREQLLAARVYLDKWISRLEKEEAEAGGDHERIEIE